MPGLRPSRYTGGSATWEASATRDSTMATMIPFKVPNKTTPAKAVKAQVNSVRRISRIARNSCWSNQSDRVDDDHSCERGLRHGAPGAERAEEIVANATAAVTISAN